MIELVDDVPHGVFGLRAGGLVTPEEYHAIVRPALSTWLDTAGSLRVLALIEPDFSYADGDWHTASDGVLQRPEWNRLGVVTDSGWLRMMAPLGSRYVPARVRGFRTQRVQHARAWVAR